MELDPVDVLHHLNDLGYENVEPQLLQKFMKDLKKLIKYETQKSRNNEKENIDIDLNPKNRCLLKEKKNILQNNHCKNIKSHKKNDNVFERLSRTNSKGKQCSKTVSTVGVQTDLQCKHLYNLTKDSKNSKMLNRTQMDPVSLHHYYQMEWHNHKMPGEKNHDQLRWKVRQMMKRK